MEEFYYLILAKIMLHNNQALYSMKILGEIILSVLLFPVWWFTRGLFSVMDIAVAFISNRQQGLSLVVWAKNIFTPMYGQYDIPGRLISFFMRLFQIIARSIIMVIWIFFSFTMIAVWIAFPFFICYQIFFQLGVVW